MEALMPGGHLPAVSIALVGGSTATPGTNAGVWELLVVRQYYLYNLFQQQQSQASGFEN